MHAQTGTVGSPELSETLNVEITLTIRIPRDLIVEGAPADAEIASDMALGLQEDVLETLEGLAEVGVRSRAL